MLNFKGFFVFQLINEGKIVEHWDIIDYYPNEIGDFDLIHGNFEIIDGDKTEENKKIVRRYLVDVLQNKEFEKFDDYKAEDLIQHNQEISQGRDVYKKYLQDNNVTYDFVNVTRKLCRCLF